MKCKLSVIAIGVILILISVTYLLPIEKRNMENREMASFSDVLWPGSDGDVYGENPAERMESAMLDNFMLRSQVMTAFLRIDNTVSEYMRVLNYTIFSSSNSGYSIKLTPVGNYYKMADTNYLTELYKDTFDVKQIQRHMSEIDMLHDRFPNIRIYNYFARQAYDTHWFDEYLGYEAQDFYGLTLESLPEYIKSSSLEFNRLEDYMELHYKSDHHWNYKGAYKGYSDIYEMISGDIDIGDKIIPADEVNFSKEYGFKYLGSFGRGLGDLYSDSDDFCAYLYDTGDQDYYVLDISEDGSFEERQVPQMGSEDIYLNGEMDKSLDAEHYGIYYGCAYDYDGTVYSDTKKIYVIKNAESVSGHNLLMLGDSYNRAFREPMSTNFDTTVYVDDRVISSVRLNEIIRQYNIDVVLLSCHTVLYLGDYSFNLGGGME